MKTEKMDMHCDFDKIYENNQDFLNGKKQVNFFQGAVNLYPKNFIELKNSIRS